MARMPLERRTATLLAFVWTLEGTAQDDVLDLFDIVATTLFTDAAKVGKKARLRTIRDLDAAALQLRRAGGVLMDEAVKDDVVREAAFAIVPRARLAAALEQIDAIVRPLGDLYFTELRAQTGKLRFLPAMLRSVALGAAPVAPELGAAELHPCRTLTRANAALVAAQNRVPLAHVWGGGDVASADGLRFVVPVRTIHSGPNPRYYGQERGVTFYNLVSDQFTGLNGITVPDTLRDSLSLLSVVLEQQTELQPTEIMSDSGAYTDGIFGIFHLLGYQFSPRLADIGGTRFWRIDVRAEDVARLSPLGFDHINMLGRYAFILPDLVARGELRPLRNPAVVDDEG